MPDPLSTLLGDTAAFYGTVSTRVEDLGIDLGPMTLSHVCVRVETFDDYRSLRDALLAHAVAYTENDFNGRPVSLIEPRDGPLLGGKVLSLIELPAPRAAHTYPHGLEHVGFIVAGDFGAFVERHRHVLTGAKDRGADFKPVFISFDDGLTAKFYPRALREVVEAEGGVFQPVSGTLP